jgi:hypothetical protein
MVITIFIAFSGLAGISGAAQAPSVAAAAMDTGSEAPDYGTITGQQTRGSLPDAPAPAGEATPAPVVESSSLSALRAFAPPMMDASSFVETPRSPERVPLRECPTDTTHARECRMHWRQLFIEASVFNAFQNAGNLYTGYYYRRETTHGKWLQRWFDSDLGWNWQYWDDGNPLLDQYVGHPMMGGITNYVWIQNDPKGATVQVGEPGYWKSRMRALAFTTAYHFEWKFGPFGEAGVGHIGDHGSHIVNGKWRNDTGDVELVTTPVGGLVWTMAEDALDKTLVRRFEEKPRSPAALLLISFLTPARATANILRWRTPWYRDGRMVRTDSFWSEPPGPDTAAEESGEEGGAPPAANAAGRSSSGIAPGRTGEVLPLWPHYGGKHEFGAWWGASLMTGHIWGYAKDVKYMPIDVTYSYLLHPGSFMQFRYAPEITALAMLSEPTPNPKGYPWKQRKRTYGSGVSPVGFRASFLPDSKVQPFLSTDGGFIYFTDRVLSPQGSQFMYTIDFGGGLQFFRKGREAMSLGYRYQHLSNANISHHNPGTDTNVFYLAVSRFRTKGYR